MAILLAFQLTVGERTIESTAPANGRVNWLGAMLTAETWQEKGK
jgi:hypothetical protein